jgi:Xaa-Pro dipeptidase
MSSPLPTQTVPTPICTPPDGAEIAGRLARVQAGMADEGLDAYVAVSPDNVYYLTNFANFVHERPFVLVVRRTDPPYFVVPTLERSHVEARSIGRLDLVCYFEYPAPEGARWCDRFRTLFRPGARVGVESACPLEVFDEVPGERVRTDIVNRARMVKSHYEVGRLAHAARVISEAHAALLDMSRPGVTMLQIYGEISALVTRRVLRDIPGANMLATSSAAIVLPPSISHDPHNFTGTFAALEEGGPHVSGVMVRANGYAAELERTFFLGSVPEPARRPFETMMEARRLAFELLRPGAGMSEIDERVTDVLVRAGYQANLLHRTGHSFGVTGHEAPFLARGSAGVVEAGMLFSVEPGIYLPGVGGFRHSDTVLVTDRGNVSLTSAPDTLEALTVRL